MTYVIDSKAHMDTGRLFGASAESGSSQSFMPTYRPRPAKLRAYTRQRRVFHVMIFLFSLLLMPVVILRRLLGAFSARAKAPAVTIYAEAKADAGTIIPYVFMG